LSVLETTPGRSFLAQRAAYTLRLPVFEGPLDLLLQLIRSHKLDISEVSISLVAEQYMEFLSVMEALDLEIAGEFLVTAATLMEIKSRTLLPRPEPLPGDEDQIDPREELVQRLLEYERFQHVAEQLRELALENGRSFTRTAVETWEGAIPLVELKPADLLAALRLMRADEDDENGKKAAPTLRVRRNAVNLRQRMSEVVRRVEAHAANGGALPFSLLVYKNGARMERLEVLVTFLAVLELVRLGQLTAWQRGALGEILLTLAAPAETGAGLTAVTN
jgi:segregation and condensation protein A